VTAGTASGRQLAAAAAKAAARQAPRAGRTALGVARKHPYATAAFIAYVAHKEGVSLETAQHLVQQEIEIHQAQPQFFLQEQIKAEIRDPGRAKRKLSKANKAVKYGMGLLKGGTKAATGADKGKLPKGAFKMAVKAAGLANPNTKSKIGRGPGKVKSLARKIRTWW